MRILITSPSLKLDTNISGISYVVNQIIYNSSDCCHFIHFVTGKGDKTNRNIIWLFQSLFIVGSILLFVFYLGFHRGLDNGSGSMLAPVFFVLSSFLGVIVACFFPLDAGGEIASWRGKMHLGLIALSGVLLIPAMVLLYVRLRFAEGLQGFAIFSLVTAPVTLILVIVMSFFTGSRYMGLVERFMVSAYQIYYFVSGLVIFLRN